MNIDDFRQMYLTELQELRSVEDQLVRALPEMAGMVAHAQLKHAIQTHVEETRSQRDRLDGLLRKHGVDAREHQDGSMQAILREADRWARMVSDPDCRDAGVIASAQRVEHYEIAVYGTLASWAGLLALGDDAHTLHDILDEEKRTDEMLSSLAKQVINPDAMSKAA